MLLQVAKLQGLSGLRDKQPATRQARGDELEDRLTVAHPGLRFELACLQSFWLRAGQARSPAVPLVLEGRTQIRRRAVTHQKIPLVLWQTRQVSLLLPQTAFGIDRIQISSRSVLENLVQAGR